MLLDLRAASWTPLNAEQLAKIRELLGKIGYVQFGKALERIEHAGNAGVPVPLLGSCLFDPEVTSGLKCQRQWLPAEVEAFRRELFPVLVGLACQSSAIAGGLIRQIDSDMRDTTDGRFGLAGRFAALLEKQECEGLSSLPKTDKHRIRELAKYEKEERRGQSEPGKPAREVPAAPKPPTAITPATP